MDGQLIDLDLRKAARLRRARHHQHQAALVHRLSRINGHSLRITDVVLTVLVSQSDIESSYTHTHGHAGGRESSDLTYVVSMIWFGYINMYLILIGLPKLHIVLPQTHYLFLVVFCVVLSLSNKLTNGLFYG